MPHDIPSTATAMFSYRRDINVTTRSFGSMLKPRYIFGADPFDQ